MLRKTSKIKKSLLVFFFACFELLCPFISLASWVDDLKKGIGVYILFIIVKLAVNIAKFFTGLAGSLLNWVLGPNFISYSYTNPGGPNANPIIEAGLNVTRGFVNMLLVLVLVYIAIATILRLAGYETKKLLITFIIVALLVNFAPVICGLIVDASNIIMNFFVQDLKADAFGKTMARKVEEISAGFTDRTELESGWDQITQLAVMVPFLWVLTFILLLLTFIFMLRYVVIWLLVILSPLAFVCYILPITKKYWEMWWKQFIAWSFIGVTCGFFLYLGLLLVTKIQLGTAVPAPTTGQGTGLFDSILPYFVSAVFLGIGFVFGLQTSAIGATTVVNFAKARGRGSLRSAGRGAGWVGRQAARGVGRFVEEKAGIKEKVGKVSEKVSKVPTLRWFLPEKVKKYGEFRPAIDEARAEAKSYKSPVLMDDVMTGAAIGKRAAGFSLETIMRGDSEDIFNAGRKKFGKGLNDEQLLKDEGFRKIMKRTLQVAREGGYHNDIIRRDPRLAALLAGESWAGDYAKMTEKQAIQQATSEARGSHITNWEKQVVSKEHLGLPVTEKLMERGREPFENIARNVKEGVETVQESIDTLFSNYVDTELEQIDSALAAAVRSGLDKNATKKAWGMYHENFKAQPKHKGKDGFFVAVKSQRFRDFGYREGKYTETETPSPGPTPGGATMVSPPPPSGRRSGSGGPTGRRPGGRKYVESKVVENKPPKKPSLNP